MVVVVLLLLREELVLDGWCGCADEALLCFLAGGGAGWSGSGSGSEPDEDEYSTSPMILPGAASSLFVFSFESSW